MSEPYISPGTSQSSPPFQNSAGQRIGAFGKICCQTLKPAQKIGRSHNLNTHIYISHIDEDVYIETIKWICIRLGNAVIRRFAQNLKEKDQKMSKLLAFYDRQSVSNFTLKNGLSNSIDKLISVYFSWLDRQYCILKWFGERFGIGNIHKCPNNWSGDF